MLAGKPCWPGVLCEFGFARRTTEACERAWLLGGGAHRGTGKYGIARRCRQRRAECGDRNHHPNVEAGFCRGINGNEYEDRFCQCAHRIAAGGRNRISARANSSYV
jgi:hypothetical protein